jgi:HEXXH motif-containing protein
MEPWAMPEAGDLTAKCPPDIKWLFARIRPPNNEVRAELESRGFGFRDTPQRRILLTILSDAARLLATAPSLEAGVEAAVGELVLLRARPAFDISHSEPRWPVTIFVSVPCRPRLSSALRAVENVIHEAMHLRLTTAERTAPLVADMTTHMTSPWRKEPRLVQGVLHGLYVFGCISAFFATPALESELDAEGAQYVARRRDEIAAELSSVDIDRLTAGLTPRGRALVAAIAN